MVQNQLVWHQRKWQEEGREERLFQWTLGLSECWEVGGRITIATSHPEPCLLRLKEEGLSPGQWESVILDGRAWFIHF